MNFDDYIYNKLQEKVPTYRELADIKIVESCQKMIRAEDTENLYVNNIDENMKAYTGDDIYLRDEVYNRLREAADNVCTRRPDLMLQLHYGYRSLEIQTKKYFKILNEYKQNKDISDPEQAAHIFVANPSVAGHPTGGAVDVTLIDRETKKPVDMGGELMEFTPRTMTFYPNISPQAWKNRNFLRNAMIISGFAPYDGEWWHFSYGDREWAYVKNEKNAFYGPIDFKIK